LSAELFRAELARQEVQFLRRIDIVVADQIMIGSLRGAASHMM
jgi:hypothetical protein